MAAKKKKHKGKKHTTGGEAKKPGKKPRVASQKSKKDLSEAKDNKRGNIGPSGQGNHRGREARNRQSQASGRPDIPSVGGGNSPQQD